MSISGQQNINIGQPNESVGSDSLFTAFTKTQENFNKLFSNASPYNTFNSGEGIGIATDQSNGAVTITNQGVTQINAGTGIVVDSSNGNVTISSTGGGNGSGGTVTSVGVYPVSNTRLVSSRTTPIVSSGDFLIDLASSGVTAGSYTNPTVTVDEYGRITSASNNTIAGTVTSVGLVSGPGIQIGGGPITSNGNITVTNTGVLRINAGSGINLSGSNGNVTISTTGLGGTVTSVVVVSDTLDITGSPIVTAGTIGINLPNSASFSGNVGANIVNANRINANGGNINGNLIVTGNISPAAVGKVGGIKPGPGVDISLDGELTIDTANLPLSFGNFTASNNVLSIVNADEDMILQTEGNAEIQLVGNIGFYKPDGLPPNVANRYFSATSDGQIKILVPDSDPLTGAVEIIGSTSGNTVSPAIPGVMLHVTGQNGQLGMIYADGIANNSAYVGRRYNGLASSPTQVLANDVIMRITAAGYTNAGFQTAGQGTLSFDALENFTTTSQGTELKIYTTAIGSNTRSVVATVNNANGVVATKLASTSTLSVTGNANVGNIGATTAVVTTANVSGNVNAGNIVIPTGNIIYTPRHGAFYSNVDQTNPVANTARAMTFNNTVTANGVSVVSNSQLTIAKPGIYNIQFSAQVNKTGGGTGIVDIWLNKNGTPVDWTNTSIPVTSGSPQVAAWNFVENVTIANTYFEIMWSSADTSTLLNAVAANTNPTRPGIPSVIVSVTPVGA